MSYVWMDERVNGHSNHFDPSSPNFFYSLCICRLEALIKVVQRG